MIGRRMELAANQNGYTTCDEVARLLRVSRTTVGRWWAGTRRFTVEDLERYAEALGKPAWWFLIDARSEGEFDLAAETLRQIFGLTVAGKSASEALDLATGHADLLSRPERRVADRGTPALVEAITRAAEGPWEELPADRQREIVDRLASKTLPPSEG